MIFLCRVYVPNTESENGGVSFQFNFTYVSVLQSGVSIPYFYAPLPHDFMAF